ncbi:MAG: cation-transporting P-type ATPase, partial [Chloroflexi bacterium]|nr:cation-transporting P-type ATPase [Chloroflexota bacterium]
MIQTFNENDLQGLTEQEARERLAAEGFNELPSTKTRSLWHLLFDVVREPMFLLLLISGL